MSSLGRKYMSKRQRPCDFCRGRKSACQIDRSPPCKLCAARGRSCTFEQKGSPRRVTAAASVSQDLAVGSDAYNDSLKSLPMAQNLVPNGIERSQETFNHSDNLEPMLADNSSTLHVDPMWLDDQGMAGFWDHLALSSVSAPPPDTLQAFATQAQRFNGPIASSHATTFQVVGASGDLEPCLLEMYCFDEAQKVHFQKLAIQSAEKRPNPVQFLLSDPSLYAPSKAETCPDLPDTEQLRARLETSVPVKQGALLIDLYKKYVAPSFPIFSAEIPPDPSTSPPFLLAAIYSSVRQFTKFDDSLGIELAYAEPSPEELISIASIALRGETHTPSMSVLQTLLLLVVQPSGHSAITEAPHRWSLMGSLVACSQTLGLQYDCTEWSGSQAPKAERLRMSFLVYAVDKWMACGLGRPPLITRDNWMICDLADTSLQDTGLTAEQLSTLKLFASLTTILNDVLVTLYSIRSSATRAGDYRSTLEAARPLIEDLDRWHNSFKSVASVNSQGADLTAASRLSVELGYHYVRLNVFRAIMRKLDGPTDNDHSFPPATTEPSRSARIGMRACTSAFLSYIRTMSQDLVHSFWPYWAQAGFSSLSHVILYMAVTSVTFDEALEWAQDLDKARKNLRLKASFHPVFRLASIRIDSIFWKDITKVIDLQPHVRQAFGLPG